MSSLSSVQAQRLCMRGAAAATDTGDDDDLLLTQQRFLFSPSQAAATVTRAARILRPSPSSISSVPPSVVAPFSHSRAVCEGIDADTDSAGLHLPPSRAGRSVLASVLSSVVERDPSVTAGRSGARGGVATA